MALYIQDFKESFLFREQLKRTYDWWSHLVCISWRLFRELLGLSNSYQLVQSRSNKWLSFSSISLRMFLLFVFASFGFIEQVKHQVIYTAMRSFCGSLSYCQYEACRNWRVLYMSTNLMSQQVSYNIISISFRSLLLLAPLTGDYGICVQEKGPLLRPRFDSLYWRTAATGELHSQPNAPAQTDFSLHQSRRAIKTLDWTKTRTLWLQHRKSVTNPQFRQRSNVLTTS